MMTENARLKEEIQKIVMITLRDYYELSKYNSAKNGTVEDYTRETLDEIENYINNKIDESMTELKSI